MPILDIIDSPIAAVIQQCANCGGTASVPRALLVLGHHDGDLVSDPNLIVLPACVQCGAVEALNQTFDSAPEELAHHRKKVNALAQHLKGKGQLHPATAEAIRKDTRVPAQIGELSGPVGKIPGLPPITAGGPRPRPLREAERTPNEAAQMAAERKTRIPFHGRSRAPRGAAGAAPADASVVPAPKVEERKKGSKR